jgi:hypothetical protein
MPPAIVIDRYGRRIEPDDGVVPDGGRVVVAMPFMDARSAHVARAFGDGLLHRPGFAQQALGDGFAATNSNERSQSASEAARENYVRRLSSAWQGMPRTATKPRPGLASYDPDDSAQDGDASEAAYVRMKQRLSDAWRTPVDDNAEGVSTAGDLPDDVAALPLAQQQAYCAAYNQHMEENPDADDADCDAAGREAIAALGQDSSVFEAIRTDAQRRYAERMTNAWKT